MTVEMGSERWRERGGVGVIIFCRMMFFYELENFIYLFFIFVSPCVMNTDMTALDLLP